MEENKEEKARLEFHFGPRLIIIFASIIFVILVLIFILAYIIGKDKGEYRELGLSSENLIIEKEPISFKDIVRLKRERDFYKSLTASKLKEDQKKQEEAKEQLTENRERLERAEQEKEEVLERKQGEYRKVKESLREQTRDFKEYYNIQVGSFKDEFQADNLVDELIEKGYKAYKVQKNVGIKGVWYRVKVGRFLTKEEAEAVKEELAKEINKGSFITKD